jgi:outer membrane lipoprotein-sorting protein
VKRRVHVLAAVLLTATRVAATPPADVQADLAEIGRLQAAIHTMTATFVQRRTVALFDEELVSRGRFRLKQPGRVRWDVDTPASVAMVVTTEGIVMQEAGAAPARAAALPVPTAEIVALISGSMSAVTQHFDVRRPTEREHGDVFELRPRSPQLASVLSSVTLELAPADKHVRRVVLDEATGDRTEIVFEDVKINAIIPDAEFVLGNEAAAD